ncbi:MAG TPA: hypothetical protein VE954_14355 [Oligoflexus sp.]|uniref:toxin-antitoxin system YwqK family antitoxin n=1 Tax=Oligoflexus sp. TaxID=1971216 RepID=UPI002D45F4D0|nr:hypothetical protein [Oligoflexus sp.]HYX34281.1 hypothetical protein [Oligoflexus sp.]
MYRLLIKISLLVGCTAGLGFVAKSHIIAESLLPTTLHVTRFKGEPFTGIGYELWQPWHLAKLMFYVGGRKVGTERHWYPNGALWIEREYAQGLPHGEWRQWFPDGTVRSLAHYKDGQAEGETWAWHENGTLAEYTRVANGQDITQKSWIPDGTVYQNYVFQDGERTGVQGDMFCKVKKFLQR